MINSGESYATKLSFHRFVLEQSVEENKPIKFRKSPPKLLEIPPPSYTSALQVLQPFPKLKYPKEILQEPTSIGYTFST